MLIDLDGATIAGIDEGAGPAVVLLHGWPDTADLWRHQLPALTAAGYRTIAPDLRGAGGSSRPAELSAYAAPNLVADVLGVLDHLGLDMTHLIGHDFGAAIGWLAAALAPDRVASLTALSVGHPAAFANAGWRQREKSWYMLLFQFPGIAERWLSADGFRNFREWSRHPDADRVVARLADPAALTAGLNLYRAMLPPAALVEAPIELPPIQAPTLGVWSSGDVALTEVQMTGSAPYVAGSWRYERLDGAGHWIPLDAPDQLGGLLLDFLAEQSPRSSRSAPRSSSSSG